MDGVGGCVDDHMDGCSGCRVGACGVFSWVVMVHGLGRCHLACSGVQHPGVNWRCGC
jgi:hypothetical protein